MKAVVNQQPWSKGRKEKNPSSIRIILSFRIRFSLFVTFLALKNFLIRAISRIFYFEVNFISADFTTLKFYTSFLHEFTDST